MELLLVLAGNVLMSIGVGAFVIPEELMSGGATGLGLLAAHYFHIPVAVFLGGFALGAGILAALFPTGLTKDLSDRSALIHGIASALGFFALLFLPLWRALLALETDSPVMAWACFAALGLALVFFTLFVLSDKDRFPELYSPPHGTLH